MTEAGDASVAGIEVPTLMGIPVEGVIPPIKFSNAVPKLSVTAGSSELLDPGMLIGRDGLSGQLPPDPIGFFGKNYAVPISSRR